MMDFVPLKTEEDQVRQIINRAVSMFKKTGLFELAEKWNRILRTYNALKEA